MKFVIRRAVFAVITMPIIFVAYGALYFGLGLLTEMNSVSVGAYLENLYSIGFTYTLAMMFLPQLLRLVDKVVA